MSNDEKPDQAFRVTDKRKSKRSEDAPSDAEVHELPDGGGVHLGSISDDSKIDFGNFVLSLAYSAHVAMGLVEHPESGGVEVDLDSARQTIEIIEMLRDKTKNNLNDEEEKLLGGVLYELRMAFVDATAKHA